MKKNAPCIHCRSMRTQWFDVRVDTLRTKLVRYCLRCDYCFEVDEWRLWEMVCIIEQERESDEGNVHPLRLRENVLA